MGLQVSSRLDPEMPSQGSVRAIAQASGAGATPNLAGQNKNEVLEGHLKADRVHMLLSIPPKCSVAQLMEFIKGKSAIDIARSYLRGARASSGSTFGHEAILFRL